MNTILVVDDEKYIADGISQLLKLAGPEQYEVLTAYQPKQALQIAQEQKIDILVTDINMPGMKGLDLCQAIMSCWKKCHCIILSAYSNPEYIQTAIRQDAVDYVLKSEGDEKLLEAVEKASRAIREMADLDEIRRRAENIDKSLPYLQQQLVLDALGNPSSLSDAVVYAEEYGLQISFSSPAYLLVCSIRQEQYQNVFLYRNTLTQLRSAAECLLKDYCRTASAEYDGNRIVFLIQSTSDQPKTVLRGYLRETVPTIQELAERIYNCRMSAVVTIEPVSPDKLSFHFQRIDALLHKGDYSDDAIIEYDLSSSDPVQSIAAKSVFPSASEIRLLKLLLAQGYSDQFLKQTEALLNQADLQETRMLAWALADIFLEAYREKLSQDREKQESFVRRLDALLRAEEIKEILRLAEEMNTFISNGQMEDSDPYQKVINTIRSYIETHLDQDLSINTIAGLVHFNPSYLSRIFKKQTGVSLSEYVWNLKLEKAKEMLASDRYKISQISEKLGFDSHGYFTRFFKKMTGMTPAEYKHM